MKKLILAAATIATVSSQGAQEYIVKLKPGFSQRSVNVFARKSVQNVKELDVSFGKFYQVKGDATLSRKSLSLDPAIEYVEKNQMYTINPIEAAPRFLSRSKENILDDDFNRQWGLHNPGSWLGRGKGEDVNILKAWDITKGSNDIIVAVIDTGVDYNHEDLVANMWVNEAEKNGEPGVDDDGNGYVDDVHGYDFANNDGDPMDGNGHGTHCAGVIGAVHNEKGIRGVMANVKILGLKFLTDGGRGDTIHAIQSIDYAIKAGVHVMSNSWGGGESSRALEEAIEAANDAGIIFVAAAGNSYMNIDKNPVFPASYNVDNVITVGSMKKSGRKSGFSNHGENSVHVFAPGSSIYSTYPNNGYRNLSGTSMAAPFVSGAMGLLLTQFPNITPLEARMKVQETAVKTRKLDGYSASGRMDVEALLK